MGKSEELEVFRSLVAVNLEANLKLLKIAPTIKDLHTRLAVTNSQLDDMVKALEAHLSESEKGRDE